MPYYFSRSYIKFQGHTALKIVEFDPNWAFPDSNSSLNSPMAMKCYTKLATAKERSPIVFQGHPSNFKVTWDKTSPILTQIGRFRTIGRSQLSNPSDLPCWFPDSNFSLALNINSKLNWHNTYIHGYEPIDFFFFCRSLLTFSDVTFQMAAWWPFSIFWFPDSNFSLALNINSKLKWHNTYVYV